MTPLHIRIRYHTAENRFGESGLWFSASTKEQIRNAIQTHRIDPQSIFKFEVDNGKGYEEKPIERLLEVLES